MGSTFLVSDVMAGPEKGKPGKAVKLLGPHVKSHELYNKGLFGNKAIT